MTPLSAVVNKDWISSLRDLKEPRGHLSYVRRIASFVFVSGHKKHGRIIQAAVNTVIWRVGI